MTLARSPQLKPTLYQRQIVAYVTLLVSLCVLLGILSNIAQAQTYTQGLPAVGNNATPSVAAPSKMLVDATLFPDTDMCAAIKAACALTGAAGYPAGATIDARGFTGIQVCAAANITIMLSGCVGGTGHNGGKLLLGNVNLYADGPAGGITGNYSDHTSGIGTPALIIPAQFWGIEGISRGSTETSQTVAAPGTFLSRFCWCRLARVFASFIILMLVAKETASAQNSVGPLNLGEPVVANGTGATGQTASSSPIVLDATKFIGAPDACAQINAAIVQMTGTTLNGVVDARGFTGDLKCASNMFPSDATGKLLLGNVTLHVAKTQVQPSKFQVEGTGWAVAGSTSNTVIQACTGVSLPLCPIRQSILPAFHTSCPIGTL